MTYGNTSCRFVPDVGNSAVLFDNKGPSTVTVSVRNLECVILREERLGIAKKQLKIYISNLEAFDSENNSYNIVVLHLVDLSPSTHDPSIVVSNESHNVDTFGFKRFDILDVWRKMICGTSRSKCA